MSVTTNIKKVVTGYPYAVVGTTDLAVERVREARTQLEALRAEYAPAKVQARLAKAPEVATKEYDDLVVRGEKLVERIRKQQSTQDFLGQAKATVALGKGVVTSARKTVDEVERAAKSTLTVGRKEAAKAAEAVVDSVDVDVDTKKAGTAVKSAAKNTRTSAKRTTTTAKKGAARTRTAAKSTGTSARKTTAKGAKSTTKAAQKVGD